MTTDDLADTFLDHIATVLLAVADVAAGYYETRLTVEGLSDEHPVALLFQGINQMMASLDEKQRTAIRYRHEIEEKLATIDLQRAAIRELSTPIIEVWNGVLCMPVVGVLDTTRSAEMTEGLLGAIVEKKARCAIIDVTGIQVMDTGTADHFLRMARAVRLLGSSCVLTGMNPNIARTIVHMGVDLGDLVTHRTLRTALQQFVVPSTASSRE